MTVAIANEPHFQALLALTAGGRSTWLLLSPDRSARLPALARACGHALSHIARCPPELSSLLGALAKDFEAADCADRTTDEAVELLGRAAERRGAAAALGHAWPDGFAPQTPWHDPDAPPVLPAFAPRVGDVELLGLELGLRDAIKREQLGPPAAEALRRAWSERGLRTELVRRADRSVVLAARSASVLQELAESEHALSGGGAPDPSAVERLGARLGYPRCCVGAFARLLRADDLTASACAIPGEPVAAVSPLGLWLDPSLRLVSHFACGLGCAATERLSASLLDALEARAPGLRAEWTELAQRVHTLDTEGRHVALAAQGEPVRGEPLRVRAAHTVSRGHSGAELRELTDLRGVELLPFRGGLRSRDGATWFVLAADHRGASAAA